MGGAMRSDRGSHAAVVVMCLALCAVTIAGCSLSGAKKTKSNVPEASGRSWNPVVVEGARPALVAWRSPNDGEAGRLMKLSEDSSGTTLWEPDAQEAHAQLVDIAPDGSQMVGWMWRDASGEGEAVWFLGDGTTRTIDLPKGFESIGGVGFYEEGLLVLTSKTGPDQIQTKIGLIDPHGQWKDCTLSGDIPEHWYIESMACLPNTEVVALVLRIGSGTGNRDDDALVLARRNGTDLNVFTTPYAEDSLPGCVPLRTAEGVAFARTWSDNPASDATVFVSAIWSGSEWNESVLAPTNFLSVIERGDVIAQDSAGGFWLRSAGGQGHEAQSSLQYLAPGSTSPRDTGIDVKDIWWFRWIEAP